MKNPYQIIHIIGAMQGVFLFLLLVMRKENKTANKILAALILLISINLTASFFHTNNDVIVDLKAINRSDLFIFLYGPLLLLYTVFLTGLGIKLTARQSLSFVPALLMLFLFIVNYCSDTSVIPADLWDETNPLTMRIWYVIHSSALIHLFCYLVSSILIIRRYGTKLMAYFSNIARIYLLWLRILLASITTICLAAIIQFLLFSFGNTEGLLQWFISASTVILIFVIGYFTNRQPDILKELPEVNNNQTLKSKYEKNRLGEEEEKAYLKQLMRFMDRDRPFLEPELNLRQLSEMVGIPSHLLSMLMSIHLNQNFYNFINKYRIEEAKRKLSSDGGKEYNILTIAYDSGFNSKSTFNTVFRKFEGITPSEFRASHLSKDTKLQKKES